MLFKKELFITRDMKQYNNIVSVLSKNGIKYITVMNSPTNPSRYRGVPLIDSSVLHEYKVFVARKDFEFAIECINK